MKTTIPFIALLLLCSFASAEPGTPAPSGVPAAPQQGISVQLFGKTATGDAVDIYSLRNASGMEARIINYGGILVSLTNEAANASANRLDSA